MGEDKPIKRGPGPLRTSIYIILFLIIAAVVYFDWFSPWYYGRQAKVVVTKVFHSKIVEYISKELQKCKLGESKIMEDKLSCFSITPVKAISAVVDVNKIDEYFELNKQKNPYNKKAKIIRASNSNTNDEDVGFINLSASGSNVIVKSCYKTPCNNSANSLIGTINCEKIKKMIRGNMCSFKSYQE